MVHEETPHCEWQRPLYCYVLGSIPASVQDKSGCTGCGRCAHLPLDVVMASIHVPVPASRVQCRINTVAHSRCRARHIIVSDPAAVIDPKDWVIGGGRPSPRTPLQRGTTSLHAAAVHQMGAAPASENVEW